MRPCCSNAAAASASGLRSTPSSVISRALPSARVCPSTMALTPRPGRARTSVAGAAAMPSAAARACTARARGCSLPAWTEAARRSSVDRSVPGAGRAAATPGLPSVSVPVLSKATVRMRCATSSASASRIRMPAWAATPVPAMMAAGVARPRAQGQAITRTDTAFRTPACASWPSSHQPRNVSAATPRTAGTNTAATRSTTRWIGALAACAVSTRRTMRDSVPSAAEAVASASSRPSPLTAPPVRGLPGSLGTGRLSPVSRLSSAWLRPSRTMASAGMRSPGRMTRRSPGRTAAAGTSVSMVLVSVLPVWLPPVLVPLPLGSVMPVRVLPVLLPVPLGRRMRACSGRSCARARMAAPAWRLARPSSHLPSRTRVITAAEASKYRCGMAWPPVQPWASCQALRP